MKPTGERARLLPAALCLLAVLLGAPAPAADPAPCESYGEPSKVKAAAVESEAMKALVMAMPGRDGEPLVEDPRLIAAARVLARELQDDLARQDEIITAAHALKVADAYGVYDPTLHVRSLSFASSGDIVSTIRLHYGSDRVPPMTSMGVGVAPPLSGQPMGIAVVLLADSRALLEPFPRKVPSPSSWTLRGRLVNSTRGLDPSVVMTTPDGKVKTLPVKNSKGAFAASIDFPNPGLYRLEVVAQGGGRAEMSALMLVQAGDLLLNDEGLFQFDGPEEPPETESDAEDTVLDMVNQVRQHEGLGMVLPDPNLAQLARRQAQDMKDNNYVGHVSPVAGGLADRAKALGLGGDISENVALNSSLVVGMNALLQRPVHRRAILDPKMKRVGVGVVFDDRNGRRQYYIVQEFGD